MSGLLVKSLLQPEWLQLTRLFDEAIWRMLRAIFFPPAVPFDYVERVCCIMSSAVYNPKYAIKDQEIKTSMPLMLGSRASISASYGWVCSE